jgi:NADH dehydrogenase/NADH:ubiquinone oxidoreductase subunit G
LQDILDADFIVVAGADPLSDQKVVGYFIKRAVDRGAQLTLIGEPANGLADYASLVVPCTEAAAVAEIAVQAIKVVVVYGVKVEAGMIEALQPLAERVCFLALDPAHNGKGAEAAGLTPLGQDAILPYSTLYLLLGDQHEEGRLIERIDAAFTIVQASYRSPLMERADVVLPAPIWAERSGHFTNVEDRVLPLNAALPMPAGVRDDAEVLVELADSLAR